MTKVFFSPKEGRNNLSDSERIRFNFFSAIYQNDFNVFNDLLPYINVNKKIGNGMTALLHTIVKKRYDMCVKLLDYGADTIITDNKKRSCLHISCENGQGYIVKLLLTHNNSKCDINGLNNDNESPIFCAIKRGHIFAVKQLLDIDTHGQICNINSNYNVKRQTPLIVACINGDFEIVSMSLNMYIYIIYYNICVYIIYLDMYIKFIELLCEYKAMKCNIDLFDKNQYTALMRAVSKQKYDIVKYLIKKGANINAVNGFKQTPIMIASHINNGSIIKAILTSNKYIKLYNLDHKNRDLVNYYMKKYLKDNCNNNNTKELKKYVRNSLHILLSSTLSNINYLPYLPSCVVRLICHCTY